MHSGNKDIFRAGKSGDDAVGKPLQLYRHQEEAIRSATADRNYVLTTGTGSGKSLAYIIPIVNHVLRSGSGTGVKAIIVYPMNALANSQKEELSKFLDHGPWAERPVTFERYTGQEDLETREMILSQPPDILLTNYVMMELILTRHRDRNLVRALGDLRFLVLDELHSYRERQGADVALLVRRVREASGSASLRCVGTSATLSTEGGHSERQDRLAEVGSRLFGAEVLPDNVIGETLRRDHIRIPNPPDVLPANQFVDLYRTAGQELVGIEAREHTAQVSNDERIERERRFRAADLPVLYCSPTMELGVDISQLNVVNMRNVRAGPDEAGSRRSCLPTVPWVAATISTSSTIRNA